MHYNKSYWILFFVFSLTCSEQIPLFFWQNGSFLNFGDHLSLILIERIVRQKVNVCPQNYNKKKLLGVGSIMARASTGDVIWGSGVSGKRLQKKDYHFSRLDIRAVRGPLTHEFLLKNFNIKSPQVYGDPALLFPYFFPEFSKQEPLYDYLIIPHYTEVKMFPKSKYPNVVYPTEPWDEVIEKILQSKFVISSSLHGIILAEAYKIPARWLRITNNEPEFKYHDYYLGTGRSKVQYASSIDQALSMGGEEPFKCDLKPLYEAFPFDIFSHVEAQEIHFEV